MNLRDKISFNANQKDLEVLLAEPFEIDVNDIPIIYVVGWNYTNDKNNIARTKLSEDEKYIIKHTLDNDYSSEKRIVLAYLYGKLRGNVDEEILKDIRVLYDGIIFLTSNPGQLSTYLLTRDEDLPIEVIYPEHIGKVEQFDTKYQPAFDRIKLSPEYPRFRNLIIDAIGYDPIAMKYGHLWNIYKESEKRNAEHESLIKKATNLSDKQISNLMLGGSHNIQQAYDHLTNIFCMGAI